MDADQKPVHDAAVEIWQANAHGKYAHPEDTQNKPLEAGFKGYGRVLTDENGGFDFTTVKPGRVPGPDRKEQAPHIDVSVFVRGLLRRLVTRIYFADDPANEQDAVLALVPAERRGTLMAKREGDGKDLLRFDIRLSGDRGDRVLRCVSCRADRTTGADYRNRAEEARRHSSALRRFVLPPKYSAQRKQTRQREDTYKHDHGQ